MDKENEKILRKRTDKKNNSVGCNGYTGGVGNTCGNLYAAVRNDGSGKQFTRLLRNGDCLYRNFLRVLLGAIDFCRGDVYLHTEKKLLRRGVPDGKRTAAADSVRNIRTDYMVNVMRIA